MSRGVFHMELQLKINHKDGGTLAIELPMSDPSTLSDAEAAKRYRKVSEFLHEQRDAAIAWYAKVDAKCDCFAKDKPDDHPAREMHGSECAAFTDGDPG